jgi:hypothetical protein
MRPIMTRAELAKHKVDSAGRDYRLSCDGYGDMEVASKQGWHAVSGWGRDGWDLGDWPYVVISVRNREHPGYVIDGFHIPLVTGGEDSKPAMIYELRQTVEGDTETYRFDSLEDREAAIDYLFVWYGLGREYDTWEVAGLTYDKREALDAGTLRVPERFRGPFSWARCESEEVN